MNIQGAMIGNYYMIGNVVNCTMKKTETQTASVNSFFGRRRRGGRGRRQNDNDGYQVPEQEFFFVSENTSLYILGLLLSSARN